MLNYLVPTRESMFGVQMLATALAIPVSILLYFFVERPGMEIGKRFAAMWSGSGRAVAPEPAPVRPSQTAG
jgi:peptidoglycan/LPS O-acetylase OafA/YrhL